MDQSISKTAGTLYQFSLDIHPYGSVTKALQSDWNPEDDDKIVAMISLRGEMFELNASGAFVWEALDEQNTFQALAENFSEVFDADAITSQQVIEDLVAEFQYLGLVRLKK